MTCAVIVAICYLSIDRPVAYFVHQHRLDQFPLFRCMTYVPMAANAVAHLIVLWFAVQYARTPPNALGRTPFAASIGLIVTVAFEYYAKFLFGRYWPETWIDDNPSLIRDGVYGFHPFHFGSAHGSFPSGHTARVVAVLYVICRAYPRLKCLGFFVCGLIMIALVGMNYPFVGDTIGGAFLGAMTGMYTVRFFRSEEQPVAAR